MNVFVQMTVEEFETMNQLQKENQRLQEELQQTKEKVRALQLEQLNSLSLELSYLLKGNTVNRQHIRK